MFYRFSPISKAFIGILFFAISLFANADEALTWLNKYRQAASMTSLNSSSTLDRSATNHANFLKRNNAAGHYQQSGLPGFTGVTPKDRTVDAGYLSTSVLENVSSGEAGLSGSRAQDSVSNLFSAIYHRFGFLNFWIDEIGVGANDITYVYNMGNSQLNNLCSSTSLTFGFQACSNTAKYLSSEQYKGTKDNMRKQNAPYVIYPPNGQTETYPVFFVESPHPLPGSTVSGFPISISFNEYFISSATVSRIDVMGPDGNKLSGTFMTKNNDPNRKFSELQFAFFPTVRLSYATIYNVEIEYSITPTENYNPIKKSGVFKTSFTTEVPSLPMYVLDDLSKGKKIPIISGKKYLIYYQPKNSSDLPFSQISTSYRGLDNQSIDLYDGDLFTIVANGGLRGSLSMTGSNGSKLDFFISDVDEAKILTVQGEAISNTTEPQEPKAKAKQDAQAKTASIEYRQGWNLLVSPIDKKIGDSGSYTMDSLDGNKKIYVLKDGQFILNSGMIDMGEGFLLYANSSGSSNSVSGMTYPFSKTVSKGWNFFGLSIASPKSELGFLDQDTVFVYRDNKYMKNPSLIQSGEGFFIHRP